MRFSRYKLAALCLLLVTAGCRANGSQELLERELRIQEDRIFELEALLDERDAALACKDDSGTTRRSEREDEDTRWSRRRRNERSRADSSDRDSEPDRAPEVEIPSVEPPTVEIPETGSSGSTVAPVDAVEGDVAPPFKAPDISPPSESPDGQASRFAPPRIESDDQSEAELPEPQLRSSNDFEGIEAEEVTPSAGDSVDVDDITLKAPPNDMAIADRERVRVIVEPRDSAGNIVAIPAKLAIVVLDGSKSGDEQRTARWDLESEDVATLFRKSGDSIGIDLELPWPDGAPAGDDLALFVRYITSDGRLLTRRKPIQIESEPVRSRVARSNAKSTRPAPRVSQPTTARPQVDRPPTKLGNSSRRVTRPAWSPNR